MRFCAVLRSDATMPNGQKMPYFNMHSYWPWSKGQIPMIQNVQILKIVVHHAQISQKATRKTTLLKSGVFFAQNPRQNQGDAKKRGSENISTGPLLKSVKMDKK